MRNRVFQLGHNQPQPALTLCKAELPFHFYAVCFVLVVLPFVADLTLFGPSKGRPGSANPQSFAELKVLSGAVDLVRQNSPRIVPRPVVAVSLGVSVLQTGAFFSYGRNFKDNRSILLKIIL